MPLEAAVTKRTQLALETTAGTLVAATKRLPNFVIMPSPDQTSKEYRGQGFQYATTQIVGKEWTKWSYSGPGTYGEMVYPICGIGGIVVPTTSDTTAKTWIVTPSVSNPDTFPTFSMEHGDILGAWKYAYGQFVDLTIKVNRDEFMVSGNGIGTTWIPGATMTASPTIIENVPIVPSNISVYLDTTFGGLGGTQLLADYDLEFSITGRVGPTWPINGSLPSHGGTVALPPKVTCKLELGCDSVSDAFVTQYRAAGVKYLQMKCTSPVLAGAVSAVYSFVLSLPLMVARGGDLSEKEGVYIATWETQPIADTAAGYCWQATTVNKVAAL